MINPVLIVAVCLSLGSALPASGQDAEPEESSTVPGARQRAIAAYQAKNFGECARLFRLVADTSAEANDYYNAACCFALDGASEPAFAMLTRAVQTGYRSFNNMSSDADLDTLRSDARFDELLESIKPPPIRITKNLTDDPRGAPFVYDDVSHFVRAMAIASSGKDVEQTLQTEYFEKGTPGLNQFVHKYGLTAKAMARAIEERPDKYAAVEALTAQLRKKEASIRAAFAELKTRMPDVKFPPTYFLVSDYGGIASGSPDGQLITIERRTSESIARIETLMIHELVHFQQLLSAGPEEFYAIFGPKKTLLALTIREGAAEFFADRVTGRVTQEDARTYVRDHEVELWMRFQQHIESRETGDWMWSRPSTPGQPRDVAYALGARIVEAYYDAAHDKERAVKEILSVTDYQRLLQSSRYAARLSSSGQRGGDAGASSAPALDAESILRTYVEDFRTDPYAEAPVTFGVRILGEGGGEWTVVCNGKSSGKPHADVTLRRGFPSGGLVYFVMDLETLQRIHRGEVSELTASGKARVSEVAPVEVDPTPGYDPGDEFWRTLSPLRFHFWTRGVPETVRFDAEHSRVLHGANAALLYYERGLRTVWMQVNKGQHVNRSPKDQVNPFDSMFVMTRGRCEARIGGVPRTIQEGDMVFVPKGASHEFWNDNDQPCEWILIMFGPGA